MPELPQVEALRGWLDAKLPGRVIAGIQLVDFAALKTFKPPHRRARRIGDREVARHGKMLDIDVQGVHLVVHFSRAAWLRWKDEQPSTSARPGSGGRSACG